MTWREVVWQLLIDLYPSELARLRQHALAAGKLKFEATEGYREFNPLMSGKKQFSGSSDELIAGIHAHTGVVVTGARAEHDLFHEAKMLGLHAVTEQVDTVSAVCLEHRQSPRDVMNAMLDSLTLEAGSYFEAASKGVTWPRADGQATPSWLQRMIARTPANTTGRETRH